MKKVLFSISLCLVIYFVFFNKQESSDPNLEAIVQRPEQDEIETESRPKQEKQAVSEKQPINPAPIVKKKQEQEQPKQKEGFVAFDEKGRRIIEQINQVGRHLVYHGDVLIGDVEDLTKIRNQGVVTQDKPTKWPNGKIPVEIDPDLENYKVVESAIDYLNAFTNLKITPRTDEEDFVFVTPGEADCYSYAGRIGGRQELYLTKACSVREVVHEFMHVAGFFHEQNREDRDLYVRVLWDNIAEVNKVQFKKIPNQFLDVVGRPFDFNSIMLYNSYTFSDDTSKPSMVTSKGDILSPNLQLLSPEDIERIRIAYP